MSLPDRSRFESSYAGQPPWDIGGPQPLLVAAADQVQGAILDAGCGTGENALFFAERGHDVTGIDFLEEPIRRARQKAAERNLKVNFLVMDALELDEFDQTFDSAIDSGLFHVFSDEDRRKYVAGLAKVVKSGGRLFLLCFSDAEPGDQGPRRVSRSELEIAFSASTGWELEQVSPGQFTVRDDCDIPFTPGGPRAWFVVARRL